MEEDDNDDDGPSRKRMENMVNYLTMTTDISIYCYEEILDYMRGFIGSENYYKLMCMEVKTRMKEMIKVLQEKEPENCLKILVDVLVECGCLKNTGWKEKPDPISALLLELREPVSVIERLIKSVKEGDVDKVKQLLSQYPIPQEMEHITRECCVLSLERHDLPLVEFLYQEYGRLLYNKRTVERFLTDAARVDFTEGVQFLFSQGLSPESNRFYKELLEKAKSVDMLRLLLSEEKIRQSLKDEPWFTGFILYRQILNSSTQLDCMICVQILVDVGARVEILIDITLGAAWLKIIKERWFQVFDYLLNQLKDINYTDINKQNILHVILVRDKDGDVRNNILDFVTNLVERGIDIHCVDEDGQTPLMLSCRAGYYDLVKYLIERGADDNKVDNKGQAALMWASRGGNKDIVEYLITHCGVDVNMVNNEGQTALMFACNDGKTALILACEGGHKDVVEYLIQHGGADVNTVDRYGRTALMWACESGNKDIVEYLIQHGVADVNKVDNYRRTALMLACMIGHKDVVEYLIQHCGADVDKVDSYGQTALHYCLDKYKIKEANALFKFLVESGADFSLPSNGVRLFEQILDWKLYKLFLYVVSLKPQIVDVTEKVEIFYTYWQRSTMNLQRVILIGCLIVM